jgi:hypothetical protein
MAFVYRRDMNKRSQREKLDAQFPFRMTENMALEFEEVARSNGQNSQDLLRLAVRALIRCHEANGSIPLDMELRQRTWAPLKPPPESAFVLNEDEPLENKIARGKAALAARAVAKKNVS